MEVKQLCEGEWLHHGCFIQKSEHPLLSGKYEVFKNDIPQTRVGRTFTFKDAKKLCVDNPCYANILKF